MNMANPPLYSPINPHFFQPLLPGFTNHLDIPGDFFLNHLEGSNDGKTAELRSDASEVTFQVKIGGQRLSDGWEDFAVAHDLRIGDIVVFGHEGKLVFHVTALGPSCCDIQYGEDSDNEEVLCDSEKVLRKKKSLKTETEADSSSDQSCFVTIVTASNLKRDTVYLPKTFAVSNGLIKKFRIDLVNEKGESWTIDLRHEAYSGRFYMRGGWRSFCVANGKKPRDLVNFKLVKNDETSVLQLFPLNLQETDPSNDSEKEFLDEETNRNDPTRVSECNIREENNTTSLNRFVTLTFTPTSFGTRRLNLPLEFTEGNRINKAGKIRMLDRYGAKWLTSILMDKNKGGTMSLGHNWKGFCEVNGVKMNESFVLELVWEDTVPVLRFCYKS